ncbi:MAG TPA: hypothetical protein VML54_04870 [Candidatus Limnocylindrales bacterium]|nr:hypothetical protein [Candidatus Limnocylindrales bacterium]
MRAASLAMTALDARGRVAWGLPALVAGLSIAAFLPALGHGFVNWDDALNFVDNPSYRGLGPRQLGWMLTAVHAGHYTPLTWLTLGLDYVLWGMDARGYHLTSVLLHAATAVAFYFVSLRLLRRAATAGPDPRRDTGLRIGAAVAALLFAVHPLRAESVAWVTERRDVLSGLFFLSAIGAYLRAVDGDRVRPTWYWASVGLGAGAFLSKASTVPLPAVLLLLDVYPLRRLGGAQGWRVKRVWLEKLPFVAIAVPVTVVAIAALQSLGNTPSFTQMPLTLRAMIAVYGLAFYLLASIVPLDLSPLYQLPITITWFHFALVGAVLGVALVRRWPAFTAAVGAYVLILLPVLRLLQGGPQIVADRYSYLACLGWALLAGAVVARPWKHAAAARALAAVWIVALFALTWQQALVWRSSVTLWSHAVAVNPESRAAHANLARAHAAEGRVAPAIAHWEETARLSGNKAHPHVAIGELYEKAGQPREARDRFLEALRVMPGLPSACQGLKRLAGDAAPPDVLASCPP